MTDIYEHKPLENASILEFMKTLPDCVFKTRIRDESLDKENKYKWKDVTTSDIFSDKRIVLFALPGAFTPTCTNSHLPGYEENYQKFKELGIDEVICMSVNDAFVMFNWEQDLDIKNVHMLPDGNAEMTRKLGMLVKKENLGFGERSWRYSMYTEKGAIIKTFIEPGFGDNVEEDPFEVSDAETMLEYLNGLNTLLEE